MPIVLLDRVSKIYANGAIGLRDISLSIQAGEFWLITGHSGSGKSTLLKLLYGGEFPTHGTVEVQGMAVTPVNLVPLRRRLGIVFQDYKLISNRPVFANIALVLQCQGYSPLEVKKRVSYALQRVHLTDKAQCLPGELSGGEQQRVGIARAIVHNPPLLLADEPTGNLDPENTRHIIHILQKLHQTGMTILVTTHDRQWLGTDYPYKRLELNHGRIQSIA
ncbi:MAG: ATP-binding cassette domain-containing protein [Pseudanabaenaceae cyanobacterium SKYGB_i_bin29]|nr:ATP-binding cassette domain-containing protein [Pseudanabaenaceae cyanobacterium SKYG29]MDW8421310.1 ATP-binding cassette domain-containing protein [Pseudanabaenaceae cyanobacterium SKYGB_i_bin29]